MKNLKRIFLQILFVFSFLTAFLPCQAMDEKPRKISELKVIPNDCLLHIFELLPFGDLLHKKSLVCKSWKDLVNLLFKSKNRGFDFVINISNPIKHSKYLCELSNFSKFLENSLAPPYELNCPYFDENSTIKKQTIIINSCDKHKATVKETHEILFFNFSYAKEYSTKKKPCYLYSIVKHLAKFKAPDEFEPPKRFLLFNSTKKFSSQEQKRDFIRQAHGSRTCTCGKNHLPETQIHTDTQISNDFTAFKNSHPKHLGHTIFIYIDYLYIDILNEEYKKQLLNNIMQELADDFPQSTSEVHKEIEKDGKKLTKHYNKTSRKIGDFIIQDKVIKIIFIAGCCIVILFFKMLDS